MAEKDPKKGPIVFYCKDCNKIVDTNKVGRKYVYKCKECGTKNVAFGTEKSITSFFHIKDEKEEKKVTEKEKGDIEEKGLKEVEKKKE